MLELQVFISGAFKSSVGGSSVHTTTLTLSLSLSLSLPPSLTSPPEPLPGLGNRGNQRCGGLGRLALPGTTERDAVIMV